MIKILKRLLSKCKIGIRATTRDTSIDIIIILIVKRSCIRGCIVYINYELGNNCILVSITKFRNNYNYS